ncbi:MAG: FG-GAP repeat protein [Deltaproteobacteria bacterium]|nr:FG-GAP repeat protein [Deltaproteobacteria bacterium]
MTPLPKIAAIVCGLAAASSGCALLFPLESDSGLPDAAPPPATPVARFPWNGWSTGSVWAVDPLLAVRARQPRFVWEPSSSATSYELEIDDDCPVPGFANCDFPSPEPRITTDKVVYTMGTELPVSTAAPVGERYFWRIRACGGDACSPWSPVRYLDVGRPRADFDGDGLSDLAIGEQGFAASSGRTFVRYGEAGEWQDIGPSGRPPSALFGANLATGDFDGDGFGDLVVAAPGRESASGAVYVIRGSPTGLPDEEVERLDNPAAPTASHFGQTIATGDVDGDGFADLLVGAPGGTSESEIIGSAWLYRGSADGPGAIPPVQIVAPDGQTGDLFGAGLGSGADIDGDGFVDIVVGAKNGGDDENQDGLREGRAYVLRGGAATDFAAGARTIDAPGAMPGGSFGNAIDASGDLDGDGFADVLVGAPLRDPDSRGALFVYLGSRAGLAPEPDIEIPNPDGQDQGLFGFPIATCDVDADGRSEAIVGAYSQDHFELDEGNVFVFAGTPEGLDAERPMRLDNLAESSEGGLFGRALANAGDVNGDGFGDVVVGAPWQTVAASRQGVAWLYLGSAAGLDDVPTPFSDPAGSAAATYFGSGVARLDPRPRRMNAIANATPSQSSDDATLAGALQPQPPPSSSSTGTTAGGVRGRHQPPSSALWQTRPLAQGASSPQASVHARKSSKRPQSPERQSSSSAQASPSIAPLGAHRPSSQSNPAGQACPSHGPVQTSRPSTSAHSPESQLAALAHGLPSGAPPGEARTH